MDPKEEISFKTAGEVEKQLIRYEAVLKNKQPLTEQQISLVLKGAIEHEEDELITRAYLLLSSFQLSNLDHLRALDFAKLALEQSEDLPDFYWRIKALNTTASCYHLLRDYPNELKLLQQALHLLDTSRCETLEYYPLHYQTNYSQGVMYSQMGMPTIALPFIEKAFKYCEGINDRQLFFKTKLTLANLQMYKKDYGNSLAGYLELYNDYGDLSETEQWAILNNYICLIHLAEQRYDLAEQYMKESLRVRQNIGDELRLNYSHFTYAKLLYKMGRIEEGDVYFESIKKVLDKYPHVFDSQVRNDIFYEMHGARGDYQKAYEHFKDLDISFVNNDILERTIGSIFDTEKQKELKAKEDAVHFRRLNDEMAQQANNLQKMNKDLNNYARTASHDLREPLRMVSTYMSILEAKLKDKLTEEEKQFLHFAVDGSKRMDEMIGRILNSAKGSRTVMKPVDLNKVAENLKVNLTKLIGEKNATVTYSNLPTVFADDIQMLQVLQNLVTNAIKYNNSGAPQISITAEVKGAYVQILVADNGVGIPEEAREKVFEMFSRVENASGADGTGIGLSTVKSIIEKMKGRIWVEGNEPQGSIFKILLPLKP
ncbi:MAG: GHKL domain-containing protein [Chitinophagales bacterium]|nr:GHKL domain-containing protein [Chitinophagales bacterium]